MVDFCRCQVAHASITTDGSARLGTIRSALRMFARAVHLMPGHAGIRGDLALALHAHALGEKDMPVQDSDSIDNAAPRYKYIPSRQPHSYTALIICRCY